MPYPWEIKENKKKCRCNGRNPGSAQAIGHRERRENRRQLKTYLINHVATARRNFLALRQTPKVCAAITGITWGGRAACTWKCRAPEKKAVVCRASGGVCSTTAMMTGNAVDGPRQLKP